MKLLKVLLPIVILAAGVGGFMALKAGKPELEPTEVKERIWRVDTILAQPAEVSPEVLLYGTVESPKVVKAAAPSTAVVAEMLVAEGQIVAEGELLFALDSRDYLPQVEQLEAQISQERNRHRANEKLLVQEQRLLSIAQENENRAETLLKKNLGSQASLDDARRNTRSQRLSLTQRQLEIDNHPARLKALQAQLTQANTQYERSKLVAPFDAIVVAVNASAGDLVRSGDVLVSFYAPKDLEVRAQIPSTYESRVLAAMADKEALTAVSDSGHTLRLDRIAGQASSRGVSALFQIARGDTPLLAGQQLALRLSMPLRETAIAVPVSAIYGNNRLYLLADGRMQSVQVQRLGQFVMDGEPHLLVRAEELSDNSEIITTYLPNAVSGLRVESVRVDTAGGE